METILVTGGAGFIGSHVCDKLLAKDKRVLCVDNLTMYYPPETKIKNIQHNLEHPNFKFLTLDIRKKDEIEQIFQNEKVDKIIHVAGRAGVRPSLEKPVWYKETNIDATVNLLELAREYKVKSFVFASSSSVYGNSTKVPFTEDDPCNKPISPYAATKKAAEILCYTYSKVYNIPIVCLRFFSVYGPRGRPDMAPLKFTKLIDAEKPIEMYGDGSSSRDWTYVEDIVDGILAASESGLKFEIVNLGNSYPIKLKSLIKTIEKYVGKKAKIKQYPAQAGDVEHTYANIGKAKELLGYQPKVLLDEGIKTLVDWYKKTK
ncbi:SDR family NAD(P)-dependent oxidoreductase [Candidatus Woesearchaeota archaeon]|nr:SDR family NAD(P)-dependent oxidoreductase [Candidatus Woesearchaeota archaeon]